MFTSDLFHQTLEKIKPYILRTPLIYSAWLSEKIGASVYLKLECLQEGRSFKIRGATNALLTEQNYSSVIAASGGNHGLALAIAAKKLGKPCKIVVPLSTSEYRIELIRKAGAEVIVKGEAFDEADEYAQQLAKNENGAYIHPFANQNVFIGQGTVGVEILEELQPDVVVASVGGGGLLGGICRSIQAISSDHLPEIYGVETIGTDSMYQSIKAHKIVKLEKITSIANTLGAKETAKINFDAIKDCVKEILLVSDQESVRAMQEFLDNEKILVEPAASCIVAAVDKYKEKFEGKKVVLVICGSNVTLKEFDTWVKNYLS